MSSDEILFSFYSDGGDFFGCASDGSFDPKAFQQVVGAATTTYTNYENERQKQAEAQLP